MNHGDLEMLLLILGYVKKTVKFVQTFLNVLNVNQDIFYIKMAVSVVVQSILKIVLIMQIWYHVIIILKIDSRYLAKGFYDLNMTKDDVDAFYTTVTTTGNNLKTG